LCMVWVGCKAVDDIVWARKLFVFSIFTITALSVMMSLDFQVPRELLLTYAP
jgi:heme o synthase